MVIIAHLNLWDLTVVLNIAFYQKLKLEGRRKCTCVDILPV